MIQMKQAVVIDAVRTPVGRADPEKGYFRDVRADDLSARVIESLLQRTGIEPTLVEDVVWGCVQQQGEQGGNVARTAALLAGLPIESSAVTVGRNCGSSLQALNQASCSIMAGQDDVQIVGGIEHMQHVPMEKDHSPNPALFRKWSPGTMHMGVIAEYMTRKYGVPRREQDEFALRSHKNAAEATRSGAFAREIAPVWGRDADGRRSLLDRDQGIREDTSIEALSKLPPAFDPVSGSVTAGNSSQVSVGAAAMLVMSEAKARELGLKPRVRVIGMATAGVDPGVMGIGPVPAVQKALARAGRKLADMDVIEINEAFAVQTLAVMKVAGMDPNKVNLRGGAIALGHPLGASGARVATTLLGIMRDQGARFGLATMCIGGGQGIATIFEACN
jgi:acetyl-CoA acyltransferase